MAKDKQINIILEEIDKLYPIPSYMEQYVKRGIATALEKIEKEEQQGR